MFGFAAFSDAGFSSQTTADARIIAGTQVVTGTVAGATILGGAIVVVTTAGSLTSATGTTAQTVIAFPATNVVASSIAGVTPETRVIATTAGSMTATVQAMGTEYTLKLVKIPGTNLLTGSTGTPSLFTWGDVDDNVTAETWTDVSTDDTDETTTWSNV
jgi:hypothetical protein